MATIREQAWAAGLLDGEGCISISRHKRHDSRKSINYSYLLRLGLAMCDEATVKRFHSIVGYGKVAFYKSKNPKHKDQWHYYSGSNEAMKVIGNLLPFIYTKQKQAQLAIVFQSAVQIRPKGGKSKLTIEQIECRQHLQDEMKKLNKRGTM